MTQYKRTEPVAIGKTKTIWGLEGVDDLIEMENRDDITANDNPELTRQFATKGRYATTTVCRVFELLKKAGLPIAYSEQLSETSFIADKCEMIPVEAVARRYAVGSYLKRNPEFAKGENEPPHLFEELVTEFYLKTSGGKLVFRGETIVDGLDPMKGEEDPMMVAKGDGSYALWHPKHSLKDETGDMNLTVRDAQIGLDQERMKLLDDVLKQVFTTLEQAWDKLGYRLIDMKIEYGVNAKGEILVSDVIDNDSWRLWDKDWKELSKQSFRDGESLSEVERKYGFVAELVGKFED